MGFPTLIKPGARRRGKGRRSFAKFIIGVFAVLSVVLFYYNFYWSSGGFQAKKAVAQFYEFEQAGNYGSAWDLFHQQMKDKFSKDQYIQKRAQVYMQQLGAYTFRYKISGADKLDSWSMSPTTPALANVYRFSVTQSFLSVFGEMSIQQQVYAAEGDEGGWKLIWSFHEVNN